MPEPPIGAKLGLDPRKLPAQVFERLDARAGVIRDRRRRADLAIESFGKPGRDPAAFAAVAGAIALNADWIPHLRIAQLNDHWDQVVGPAIARHTVVDSYDEAEGVLTIRAQSQAWATQLAYLVPQLKATIAARLEGLVVERIRVTGPQTGWTRRKRAYSRG
ncbi:DUF721 domain-containing protein [Bifidobacterium pullorum subsp. saeculare]|uniref:DUF721 domain-containing protein n=1 Tax=Bifidobacterium pullorum subsp. saeculare TaxID=78257 RepID=A0A938WYD5_9BIFI|nr:DUF721 domain-containing protein [Bifidobacterium pullorum]MBM6699554.1 DUF721 domain-containing protein [Bifidobacterium pullorum subsp. saeculare]